jgi:tetratricopeptide (TPR) repeat protein
MRNFILPCLLLTLSPVLAQDQPPAAPAGNQPAAETPSELLPNQQAFLNLPEERRKEFAKQLMEANRLFQQKRVFEALSALNKAEAIFPDSPELLNLRGACLVEFRSFDKAMTAFEAASRLSPDDGSIKFNIAEVLFVSHDWQKAHDKFIEVLEGLNKDAEVKSPDYQLALRRLVEFKILLCLKKLGKHEEAVKLADKYDIDDDSPFHCYAKAALYYEQGDQIKAEEWLARAGRIFRDPATISPWQDTLVEYGYIKSFYGADLSTGGEE